MMYENFTMKKLYSFFPSCFFIADDIFVCLQTVHADYHVFKIRKYPYPLVHVDCINSRYSIFINSVSRDRFIMIFVYKRFTVTYYSIIFMI